MADKTNRILIFGGVAGLITTWLLGNIIQPALNFIGQYTPEISAKLASETPVVSINIRESLTGLNGALSGWLADALHFSVPTNMWMPYIMGALGGALLFWLGDTIADKAGLLKGDSASKLRTVIFIGNLAAGFIIGGFVVPAIGITLANTLIAFAINAAILAWAYVAIAKKAMPGILPY